MMNRLALVGYLAFALVAVSLVNRLAAQTTPVAGLISTAVITGSTGPPSLFASGSAAAPSIAFAAQPGVGCWQTANAVNCGGSGQASAFTVQNNGGQIFSAGAAGVIGIWNVTTGGALQNVSSTSGTIVMATTTIFNASGTLTNAPCNFNDLNLLIPNAGQQCFCGNCAVGAACAAGAGGAIAKRIGGGTLSCS